MQTIFFNKILDKQLVGRLLLHMLIIDSSCSLGNQTETD